MGRALVEQVSLGAGKNQDRVAEGVIKAVLATDDITTSATALAGGSRITVVDGVDSVIVSAITGMVGVCVLTGSTAYDPEKAKVVFQGQVEAIHAYPGQFISVKEFT